MATSGSFTFNLDLTDIIEDAYERCRTTLKSGYQLRTARRSIDLILIDWINDGVNLWTTDIVTAALVDGTTSYTLDAKWIDVLDATVRDSNNNDTELTRITLGEYIRIPKKSTEGKPTQFAIERNTTSGHTLYFWPTPDASYTFRSWGVRHMEDAGAYTNNLDMPRRFLPALVAGLASDLSRKSQALDKSLDDEVGIALRRELKAHYVELYTRAKAEDRDRASFYFLPAQGY